MTLRKEYSNTFSYLSVGVSVTPTAFIRQQMNTPEFHRLFMIKHHIINYPIG